MREEDFAAFRSFRQPFVAASTAALLSEVGSDRSHARVPFEKLFFIALTYHCLCLGDRRGRFGRSYRCSSFGGHIAYIHHLFQRMLLSCGVWSVYGSLIACASSKERLYVWEARGFTSTSLLHLHKSLFVPFSVLFLGQVIFPYSMAVYVFVVCMYVSVWCGGAPLSLSLWIVAGMVAEWLHSRGVGEDPGPACNCGDAEGMERAITGPPTSTS